MFKDDPDQWHILPTTDKGLILIRLTEEAQERQCSAEQDVYQSEEQYIKESTQTIEQPSTINHAEREQVDEMLNLPPLKQRWIQQQVDQQVAQAE